MDREPGSAGIYVGQGAKTGNITVHGNIAGRDVVIGASPADAEAANDRAQLLDVLERVEQRLAELDNVPSGLGADATDDLRKARQAATDGDADRAAEKLGTAQQYLERIGQNLPAALTLAQTVATVAARLAGLG